MGECYFSKVTSMGVFRVFKIVQIVPNRTKHHKYTKVVLTLLFCKSSFKA